MRISRFLSLCKVIGARASTTVVDGQFQNIVFTIPKGVGPVTLSGLTIRKGQSGWGGGIYTAGTLEIDDSIITDNLAAGIDYGAGGGILINMGGKLTLKRSTVNSNYASGDGGGIYGYLESSVIIENSAITGNQNINDYAHGGGVENAGVMTINNSTINGNSVQPIGNGPTYGGGIYGGPSIRNSIVANNTGGNCYGTPASKGFNLSSDGTCQFKSKGDLNNTNPKLGPLQNNGGPTQTQALLPSSPAIDAGNPKGCTDGNRHLLKTDQRGEPRPDKEDKSGCDMGAYERQED
jgi:hypothetical protein